ncbi:MAG TPA: methyltransferase domain-containing protein [Streptosporangiaceae bacterium]|nr:methyltransferase domain-containing protein [Streptosporangiaceae bacterium]
MPPATGMFATCLPGLGQLVRQQLDDLPGIAPTDDGFDGRADVVLFDVDRVARRSVTTLRTTEDVFVEVGRADRRNADNCQQIARMIWRPEQVQRALSIWAELKRPLTASMTFRVITRLLSEKAFLRTELRHQLTETIKQHRPRWKVADPAKLEVWICEYRAGRFISGLRLSDVWMRQHGGRKLERRGAPRPTLAAAMVDLAGTPGGILLDPCCGSGTILTEASAAGWSATGTDIDPDAVSIASRNAPSASVHVGDARRLDIRSGSVQACASNLPFGRQYQIRGNVSAWLSAVLREAARVTQPGGHIILLGPDIARATRPASLTLAGKLPVRVLGVQTTIWHYQRR